MMLLDYFELFRTNQRTLPPLCIFVEMQCPHNFEERSGGLAVKDVNSNSPRKPRVVWVH